MPGNVRTRLVRAASIIGVAGLGAIWAPQPVGATEIGGYELHARADAVHVEMFEPGLPIPAEPQGDLGFGHTAATASFGPNTRGTASAVWPGDVVGDGFGVFAAQFGGDPNSKYPDQVNAFYPNKPNDASQEFGKGTGNGEFAKATDGSTDANVHLVGIAGSGSTASGTSGLSGLSGVLSKPSASPSPTSGAAPVPAGAQLAALIQTGNVFSDSNVSYTSTKVSSTAHTHISDLALLGGLISIKNIDMTATASSDGTKATSSGTATMGGVSIAGQDLGLTTSGVKLGPSGAPAPDVKTALNGLLKTLGISVDVLPGSTDHTSDGASASQVGLVFTIDTKVLRAMLGNPGDKLATLLAPILKQFPQDNKYEQQFVSALYGIMQLGPEIVINVGDVLASVNAAPAYTFTAPAFGGVPTTLNPNPGSVSSNPPTGSVGGGLANIGASPSDAAPIDGSLGGTPTAVQPVAKALPPLGKIPPMYTIGALVLAAGLGWLFKLTGGPLALAGARVGAWCPIAKDSKLPNLREGQ